MNMCIVIDMNIYITKENEEQLRGLKDYTMSGLVNHLLANYFGAHSQEEVRELSKKIDDHVEYVKRNAPEALNPFACKKCGSMLVAGKCLTKH